MKKRIIFLALFLCAFFLASCGSGDRITEISSVSYSEKTGSLEIKATLDAKTVKAYRRDTIYLIEVPASNTIDDISTLIPVSRAKTSGELSFSLALLDGARTRLYSGFALAVFEQESGYVALSDVHYIDNPEALATNKTEYPKFPSIKGLSIVSSSDALLLSVKHTVIRIPIEDFILSSGSDEARTVTFDGDSHYLSADKIDELDYKIKNLTEAGIEVALEFTLDTDPQKLETTLSLLARKKSKAQVTEGGAEAADASDTHYAISVSDGSAYRTLASLFDFFASRYTMADGKYGFAGAFIIGHGANSEVIDPSVLSQNASDYASLLRLARTALCSRYANGKVFASIDNSWVLPDSEKIMGTDEENTSETDTPETSDPNLDWQKPHDTGDMPIALRTKFGGKEFLTVLSKEVDKGGEFNFGVAVMPNASNGDSAIWNDPGATEADDTEYISMKNISVLGRFLASDRMTYKDNAREIFIYNLGISSENESMMTASYAYAYGKALEANAVAFVYNGHFDYATGNGKTGLFACDDNGQVTAKRQIYNLFRDIDRKEACEQAISGISPGADWQSTSKRIIKAASWVAETSAGHTSLSASDEKKYRKAKPSVLFDFTKGLNFGFYPADSVLYTEMGTLIDKRALKAVLAPKYVGENMGVRSEPIDVGKFDGAKYLSTVIHVDLPEGNTCRAVLALSQSPPDGSYLFTSAATVQSGNRQTVFFDLSNAEISEKLGDVKLSLWVESPIGMSEYYMGADEADSKLCTLLIESISLATRKFSLTWLWVILTVILVAVLAFFGYVYISEYRLKRSNARRRGHRPAGMNRPSGMNRPLGQMQAHNTQRPYSQMYAANPNKGQNRGTNQRNGNRYYGNR